MSIMQAPRAPKVSNGKPRLSDGKAHPITITKPNGETIVLAPHQVKVARVKPKSKRKPKRVKANRATRTIKRNTIEQDNKWIELQERREATLKALGSIHLNDN